MPKILIVDDDASLVQLALQFLRAHGMEVVTAGSVFDTSAVITAERPDLVLVDVNMPGLAGNDLVRIARRHAEQDCRFVLYSALPVETLQQLAAECGADGYIQKSGRMYELAAAIEGYLQGR